MSAINLDEIHDNSLYDADDVSALFHVHRTTVHRQIFPKIVTQRMARRLVASGYELKRYARGETHARGAVAAAASESRVDA